MLDDDTSSHLSISAIHDDAGYQHIRRTLSNQYNLSVREPNIQVYNVNRRGDRSLTIRHMEYRRRPLAESLQEVMRHLARLWGFTVRLEAAHEDGKIELLHECKAPAH